MYNRKVKENLFGNICSHACDNFLPDEFSFFCWKFEPKMAEEDRRNGKQKQTARFSNNDSIICFGHHECSD